MSGSGAQRGLKTLGGHEMAFVDSGNRLPLLLVHGFPLDHTVWAPQVETFSRVRRVIAPDLIGFGSSTAAERESLDDHADDLAALLDGLDVERAVVVGLSMGGYVALAMWRRHRHRIGALALVDARSGPDTTAARSGRYQTVMAIEEHGTAILVDRLLPNLLGAGTPEAVRAQVERMMLRQPADGVNAALRAMAARPSSAADLPGIDVPTAVIVGAEDVITPVAESEAMAAAIPGAELVVVPGAGHLANLEEPGAFNAALRTFLEAVDAN